MEVKPYQFSMKRTLKIISPTVLLFITKEILKVLNEIEVTEKDVVTDDMFYEPHVYEKEKVILPITLKKEDTESIIKEQHAIGLKKDGSNWRPNLSIKFLFEDEL